MDTSAVIRAVRACSEAQLRDIERATGIALPTLAKIRYGVTTDPRGSTVDKLRAHFEARRDSASASDTKAAA
jgi:predicted nucleic acid-binding protein